MAAFKWTRFTAEGCCRHASTVWCDPSRSSTEAEVWNLPREVINSARTRPSPRLKLPESPNWSNHAQKFIISSKLLRVSNKDSDRWSKATLTPKCQHPERPERSSRAEDGAVFSPRKPSKQNIMNARWAQQRGGLPGRSGVFRAGKQDMLQIPPWHRTIYLLMNWIMNGFSSGANYIQCVTSEAASRRVCREV